MSKKFRQVYTFFSHFCAFFTPRFFHEKYSMRTWYPPIFQRVHGTPVLFQHVHGTMHFFNAYMVCPFNALLRTKITAWQQVPSGLYVLIAHKNYSFSSTLRMRSPSLMSAGEMLCPARFACTKLFLYVRIR